MTEVLDQLASGRLAGTRRLDLAAGLTEFPREIFSLADSLEILNLTGNRLERLPDDLPRLHRLRVLFCSENRFTDLPAVLGRCPALTMVGFKSNHIAEVPAGALPPRLRWLILTDNAVGHLPDELGHRPLQKLMLAGNRLERLPDSLASCSSLELLRISANRFATLPDWLTRLPHLAWLAYAGNPVHPVLPPSTDPGIPWNDLVLHERLGDGASGVTHRATWTAAPGGPRPVAVKRFKGAMTSDGLPGSELAAGLHAGRHPHLVPLLGRLTGDPDGRGGLVLDLLPAGTAALAGPPSLDSCTRDVYAPERRFTPAEAMAIARAVAAAGAHLHDRGLLHGDLYAHNLLLEPGGACRLSDLGAAAPLPADPVLAAALTRLDVLAYGRLIAELAERTRPVEARLAEIGRRTAGTDVARRPSFTRIVADLAD